MDDLMYFYVQPLRGMKTLINMSQPVQPVPYVGPLRRKIDKQPIPIDGEDWHSIIKRECEKITCLDDIE